MLFTSSLTLDIFGVVVALVAVIIGYVKWCYTYWNRVGLEYLEPTLGTIFEGFLQKETIGQYVARVYRQMKARGLNHAGFYMFHFPVYMPIHPDLIKHIVQMDFSHFTDHGVYFNERDDPLSAHLFAIEGIKWRNLRAKISPTFTSGKMKMMFPLIVKSTHELTDVLDHYCLGDAVEIKEILARLTTDIIGTCAFGLDCNSLRDPNTEFRTQSKRAINLTGLELAKNFVCFFLPNTMRLLGCKIIPDDVATFFMGVVKDTIKFRESNNVKRNDFMQLLIQLKNTGLVSDDASKSVSSEVHLTIEELAAQAFVFFLAGFETSSTTMSFCLLELSTNEDIQEKLREEINTVLAKHNGELTYEAMMEMRYMDMVVYETLRKYPPLPTLNRVCTKDYRVPDTDIVIKKGVKVSISVEGLHYDPEYYEDPNMFDPTRFSDENKQKRHQFTYLPFGEGPRICIGLRFGLMQTKVGLTTLLKNYKFRLNPQTEYPIKMNPKSFLNTPLGGIWMNIEKIIS